MKINVNARSKNSEELVTSAVNFSPFHYLLHAPKLTSTNEFKLNGLQHELPDWFNYMSNLLCARISIYTYFFSLLISWG